MKEHAPHGPERSISEHQHEKQPLSHENQGKTSELAKGTRHEHAEQLHDIREKASSAAKSTKEALQHTAETDHDHTPTPPVNRELKSIAYRRTLKRTQRQLPAAERAFSSFIHQPAIEAVSEFAGKTIARPSGVLLGGIIAFLGSSAFLWIARHYGYEYNFLIFALLFVGGFLIGLLVELGLYAASRKHRS